MLNIFNLFLFLFALWILFMISSGNLSWVYLVLGILSSALVSGFSYKMKLIENKSELLYLSFGFYRNFFTTYLDNFFSAIKLVVRLAYRREPFKPVIHVVNLNQKFRPNLALFATTINMTTGLFCIAIRENEIFVHAAEEDYFTRFNLEKLMAQLTHVNDDNLV
jgi:multisubunit Na+/H+ antiporter MnhE subunit